MTKPTPDKPQNKKRRSFKIDAESMLVNGEHIIEQAQIQNGIYWPSIAVMAVALLFALFVAPQLGALLAFVALLMIIHATLKKEILHFTLTNKRIFVRYGMLQIDVVDIRLNKIESVELERMLTGYLLGYATLVIMGTGNRYTAIPYIGNAPQIRRAYNRLTLENNEEQETP